MNIFITALTLKSLKNKLSKIILEQNIVVAQLIGQVGNQMFIYAAAKSLALRLNKKLLISDSQTGKMSEGQFFIYDFFDLPEDSLAKKTIGNLCIKHQAYCLHTLVKENNFNLVSLGNDNLLLKGYFQSDQYFISHESQIKYLFTPKIEFQQQANTIINDLEVDVNNACALHIRRGDYLWFSGHGLPAGSWVLPIEYYQRAIAQLPEGVKVYVFGNDEQWAREVWGNDSNVTVVSRSHPAVDLLLMSKFRYQILSNSTFSWWSGWLNHRTDRCIFAPEYHLGWSVKKWYPSIDIQNNDWIYV